MALLVSWVSHDAEARAFRKQYGVDAQEAKRVHPLGPRLVDADPLELRHLWTGTFPRVREYIPSATGFVPVTQ